MCRRTVKQTYKYGQEKEKWIIKSVQWWGASLKIRQMCCIVWVRNSPNVSHSHTYMDIHNQTMHIHWKSPPQNSSTQTSPPSYHCFQRLQTFESFPRLSDPFTTPPSSIPSRISELGGFPNKPTRNSTFLSTQLCPHLVSDWQYIDFNDLWTACHKIKENTVKILSTWTQFFQAFCSLDDFRTPVEKHYLSQWPQEKRYSISLGKDWTLQWSYLKFL